MEILQDALLLHKFGEWRIWRDLFTGKASIQECTQYFFFWPEKKIIFKKKNQICKKYVGRQRKAKD